MCSIEKIEFDPRINEIIKTCKLGGYTPTASKDEIEITLDEHKIKIITCERSADTLIISMDDDCGTIDTIENVKFFLSIMMMREMRNEIDSIKNNVNEKTNKIPQHVLHLKAYVRYWNDCDIIGVDKIVDEEDILSGTKPSVPCAVSEERGWAWEPIIDVENGLITNWEKGVELVTNFKVCDECAFTYFEDMENKLSYDNYVPDFLSINGKGYGDYIMITVDSDGYIKNWDKEKCLKFCRDLMGDKNNE